MVVRFSPADEGAWDYRITANIERFAGKQGQITATPSDHPGFIRPANGHHWQTTETKQPHLWMGDTRKDFASMPDAEFKTWLDGRAAQKFTHIRGYAMGQPWSSPDKPDVTFYKTLDDRLVQMNAKSIIADLVLGQANDQLRKTFPNGAQRERYITYIVSRYAAYNVTWQLVEEFEDYTDARELMRQLGTQLKNIDPYNHPRTTFAASTSAPLLADGWMDHVLDKSPDDDMGAIEHQLFAVPFVNAGIASSDDTEFRRRFWNATMNGQYPVVAETPTGAAKTISAWYELFSGSRFWEFEPYFDVDGARAIALPGVEYIVYIEKPSGPIEVRLEKHGYDVEWINPVDGAITPAKNFKSERQAFDPPDTAHDWVLHIFREGRLQGMLKSWKFESRPFLMQDIETGITKIPYEIAQPSGDEISVSNPPKYAIKLKRETRGTRSMMYLWTGEVPSNGQGARVLGVGPAGTFRKHNVLFDNPEGVMTIRVYGMNANGKVYLLDKIYRLTK